MGLPRWNTGRLLGFPYQYFRQSVQYDSKMSTETDKRSKVLLNIISLDCLVGKLTVIATAYQINGFVVTTDSVCGTLFRLSHTWTKSDGAVRSRSSESLLVCA